MKARGTCENHHLGGTFPPKVVFLVAQKCPSQAWKGEKMPIWHTRLEKPN